MQLLIMLWRRMGEHTYWYCITMSNVPVLATDHENFLSRNVEQLPPFIWFLCIIHICRPFFFEKRGPGKTLKWDYF